MKLVRRLLRKVTISRRAEAAPPAPGEGAPAQMTRSLKLSALSAPPGRINRRLRVVGLVLGVGFVITSARAVDVAAFTPSLSGTGGAMAAAPATRGRIYDRHGEILAATIETYTIYADPYLVWDDAEVVDKLTAILPDLDPERLLQRLQADTRYVEIARDVSPATRRAVLLAGPAGVFTSATPTRIYPKQRAAAHIIGYAGRDLQGLAGAELAFDAELTEPNGRVSLSIDVIAQHRVESVLRERMAYYRAEGASAVLMRVGTGEIIAMASLPDFDPNLYQQTEAAAPGGVDPLFNQASSGVYELGSVFKPLALAAGLNAGVVRLTDTYDTREPVRIGRFAIQDYRGENRVLTAREMIIHSSNIAAARMADVITGPVLSDFYRDLRLFERAPIELAESGAPQLPARWGRAATMTGAYGHGLAVSPLALTAAYAALANGGVYVPPTLRPVAPGETVAGEAVTSPAVAAQVLGVMRENIVRSQTGSADVPGLAVAGKTGTAERVVSGRYVEGDRFNTFVAVFPFDDPHYVLTVTLDRPQPAPDTHGFATAGWTAMPTAGAILNDLAGVLDIQRRDADPSARADLVRDLFLPRARAVVPAEEPVPIPQPRAAPEDVR